MLTVRIIGPMGVELDGTIIETPPNRREWSLLAWLALHPGRHGRGELAARFWPDVLDASARASLRSAVWALRRALGEAGAPHLYTSRNEVGLEQGDGLWVDALRFDDLVAGGRFEEAVAVGGGELLAGFEDPWMADAAARTGSAWRRRWSSSPKPLISRAITPARSP
jgi:DNA-binding SARP family transcriptional activator